MISYFEIGGHVVVIDTPSLQSSPFGVTVAERPERGRNSAKAESVRSPPGANETGESRSLSEEIIERGGRVRRARRAVALAMTLAAVDGPLPFGDAAAIVVLGVYASYEINMAIGDSLQIDPFRKR